MQSQRISSGYYVFPPSWLLQGFCLLSGHIYLDLMQTRTPTLTRWLPGDRWTRFGIAPEKLQEAVQKARKIKS